MTQTRPPRTVRSFVRRQGRITGGQQRALDLWWPVYGIESAGTPLDFSALFGRTAPVYLEIGFGNGHSLAEMAAGRPQHDFLGVEVHRPGVGSLLMQLEQRGLHNVRVMCTDAVEVLQKQIPDQALAGVFIFFPDPWHKKRHHKRRLIQPEFLALLLRKLAVGGVLHVATDWEDYARHSLEVIGACSGLRNLAGPGHFSPRPDYRPITKFEQRGARLGHGVWDLLFERV